MSDMIDLENSTEEESDDDENEVPLSSLIIKIQEEKSHNESRSQMKSPKRNKLLLSLDRAIEVTSRRKTSSSS